MSSELFGTFLSIIVQGPLEEFGLAVFYAPQVVSEVPQSEKSQKAQTTFAFSSQICFLCGFTLFNIGTSVLTVALCPPLPPPPSPHPTHPLTPLPPPTPPCKISITRFVALIDYGPRTNSLAKMVVGGGETTLPGTVQRSSIKPTWSKMKIHIQTTSENFLSINHMINQQAQHIFIDISIGHPGSWLKNEMANMLLNHIRVSQQHLVLTTWN